jgi:uncharacterized protein (DUF736 family)
MASQDRDGGAFFANNKKQSQNQPDYRGELRLSREVVENLNQQIASGVQNPAIELAGWKKVSNSGTTYISLSGKKPYVKDGQAPAPRQAPQGGWAGGGQQGGWQTPAASAPIDDEIPF